MNCRKTLRNLNTYLDDTLPWLDSEGVEEHLSQCNGCRQEYRRLLRLGQILRSLERRESPADLPLRLAIFISKEKQNYLWARIQARLDNLLRPVLLPALSGVILTFFLFLVPFNSFFPEMSGCLC